ncbi:MAG: mechanosensitive ion channel family protein [Puniceicoccales bacterium]|nr:mechanosensitive ion channel family protein [Puniceicoccales bacterium]
MAIVIGTFLPGMALCLRGEVVEIENYQPSYLHAQALPSSPLHFNGQNETEMPATDKILHATEGVTLHYGREVGHSLPDECSCGGTCAKGEFCCPQSIPRKHIWYSTNLNDIIAAVAVLILTVAIYIIFIGRLFTALEVRFQRSSTNLLHTLRRPISYFVLLCGGIGVAKILIFAPDVLRAISRFFRSGTLFFATWMATCLSDALFDSLSHRTKAQNSEFYGILPLLKRACHLGVGIVGALLVIDGLGFSVNGVFATLGIGGALIALAAKDSMANIFGSLSVVLDRPFKVGDWIKVGDGTVEGDVEQIGLRSTRIRTHAKTLMVVPNSLLTNEVIDNWSRMFRRRVRQTLYVAPTARAEQLTSFVAAVESILRGDNDLFSEPRFCSICEFEPAAIQILVYYFTLCTDLEPHMRVRNRINGQILSMAQHFGINLSTPYQMRGDWLCPVDEHCPCVNQPNPKENSLPT